jgi:wyosine [tRNA(Phe)-imidazoG37] synthetase (radical SAM superfamily)
MKMTVAQFYRTSADSGTRETADLERKEARTRHSLHPRAYARFRFVYPVLSRRARGVSLGVNLSPDARCNFSCRYCQVDRRGPRSPSRVDVGAIMAEASAILDDWAEGTLTAKAGWGPLPLSLLRLNDLALSGDGEPTQSPLFAQVLEALRELLDNRLLESVKLIIITNGSGLSRPSVGRALGRLRPGHDEIWVKLDWGTQKAFRETTGTRRSLTAHLSRVVSASRILPVTIQTCLFGTEAGGPSEAEIKAYVRSLRFLRNRKADIARVQICTISRPPADPSLLPLSSGRLDDIARIVRNETGFRVETFGA